MGKRTGEKDIVGMMRNRIASLYQGKKRYALRSCPNCRVQIHQDFYYCPWCGACVDEGDKDGDL